MEAMSHCAKASEEISAEPIGVTTFAYFDEERNRPVIVECWYPVEAEVDAGRVEESIWVHPREIRDAALAAKTSRPLIVMSHGNHGDRRDRSWLAARLVQSGFIVASIEHYGNSAQTYNMAATLKFWDRPQDVSFAIGELLKEPKLSGRISSENIGFVGYSLGGMTGLALAGAVAEGVEQELAKHGKNFAQISQELWAKIDFSAAKRSYFDPRIKAILLLAPATWCYGKPSMLRSLKTPIGLVATVTDDVLPYNDHLRPLVVHSIPARMKLLRNGATHFSFLNSVTEKGRKVLQERFYWDAPGLKRCSLHAEIGVFATDFFRKYLSPRAP